MQSGNNLSAQLSPSTRAEERKMEVVLESHEGAERVVLRYSTWVEGLGWCGQKTIRLDAEELDDLHRSIAAARQRIRRRRAEVGEPPAPAKVIQLPTLA